eukprot:CAMPEP_0197841998 /NCGR_PEP_ID=MMETSP1437-20131217/46485_1 /TAXON_ID=49252 ORGANISM="Eucampia antarctica, Strain CCMP1452" /NCGR_SAMPLE_ID=MMETSP1437 /ASSEMBLY_ACC=CAM_ASM_001096 /LENGTH=828 /DNA_ID=CAMNT_0043451819 /DNA_START=48 /DNA_END=2535 /DNA_ORIENTATION=-
MDGSWAGPGKAHFGGSSWTKPSSSSNATKNKSKTTRSQKKPKNRVAAERPSRLLNTESNNDIPKYKSLIVDSGAIIKHSAFSTLYNSASEYYTVPAVLDEIRDKKARSHLESLPFQLQIRQPTNEGISKVTEFSRLTKKSFRVITFSVTNKATTNEGISKVTEFSRLTGDYQSLSRVDLQILGLLYDLEAEGCHGEMCHIRTTPKRAVGIGRITPLQTNKIKIEQDTKVPDESETAENCTSNNANEAENKDQPICPNDPTFFEVSPEDIDVSDDDDDSQNESDASSKNNTDTVTDSSHDTMSTTTISKKTWATTVDPSASAASTSRTNHQTTVTATKVDDIADRALHSSFGSMNISSGRKHTESKTNHFPTGIKGDLGGQFSDAEEEFDFNEHTVNDDDDSSDDFEYDSEMEISDEECDVLVLDPDEAEERKRKVSFSSKNDFSEDRQSQFPPLASSVTIPEESDEIQADIIVNLKELLTKEKKSSMKATSEEDRKSEALKPLSKNGQMYNSFRKYQHVVSSEGIDRKQSSSDEIVEETEDSLVKRPLTISEADAAAGRNNQSRIMGGIGMSGQGTEVDDDGEGWVTTVQDISSMKAMGILDPARAPNTNPDKKPKETGPPITSRAACATTDFAMQNVILQMSLELLTVDGMKVRKLKSWVTRCGACFTVYSSGENNITLGNTKMLFCKRCGCDYLQRIAASVDGKTGRLRLHLRKNYTQNTRGTKFALPKPGQGNRFHGDLLLREDQLLVGAWNQKRKKVSGNKEAQSIFGSDIASYVGCHKNMSDGDDLRVGFGRKNPNATKFGRERRGKKKKSTDKACGLRRYAN